MKDEFEEMFLQAWRLIKRPFSGNKKGYKKGYKDGFLAACEILEGKYNLTKIEREINNK